MKQTIQTFVRLRPRLEDVKASVEKASKIQPTSCVNELMCSIGIELSWFKDQGLMLLRSHNNSVKLLVLSMRSFTVRHRSHQSGPSRFKPHPCHAVESCAHPAFSAVCTTCSVTHSDAAACAACTAAPGRTDCTSGLA